jgi:hypothetical protein
MFMRARIQNLMLATGAVAGALLMFNSAQAGVVINFTDPSGLAGQAEFDLLDATTLQVRLRNTSTGVPIGFDSADQILTSIAFDLPGDCSITGGGAVIGPTSASLNFSTGAYPAGTNVGGEWGFGNAGGTGFGSLVNFISANTAGATAFGGPNLDGRPEMDGPQGGLVASPIIVPIGGLGAIQDEIIATLTLSRTVSDLSFLGSGVTIEFGSDAAFLVPAPHAIALLAVAGLVGRRRRRN